MQGEDTHLRSVANADGAAVLNLKSGTISTMNITGAFVWQALDRGAPVEDIICELSQRTGESKEVIERDVHEFLWVLEEQKLLLS